MRTIAVVTFSLLCLLAFSDSPLAATDPQVQALLQVKEEARKGNYKLIGPEVIRGRFLQNPDALFLVDTRQEWEYQREHIEGAVNLPVKPTWWTQYSPWARSTVQQVLGPDKSREVVFY